MKNQINILVGSILILFGCEKKHVFRNSAFPCNECTAVKTVNRLTRQTVYFDEKDTMTLRALMRPGHDSLTITRNGKVVVALPNFKHLDDMDDDKRKIFYFESKSSQGSKIMRFHYPDDGEFPLITSQVIDGVYHIGKDTVDVYYKDR